MMEGIFFTDIVPSISTLREEIKDYLELLNNNYGLLKNSQAEIKYIMDKEHFLKAIEYYFPECKINLYGTKLRLVYPVFYEIVPPDDLDYINATGCDYTITRTGYELLVDIDLETVDKRKQLLELKVNKNTKGDDSYDKTE